MFYPLIRLKLIANPPENTGCSLEELAVSNQDCGVTTTMPRLLLERGFFAERDQRTPGKRDGSSYRNNGFD
jgi:hypothetical protein